MAAAKRRSFWAGGVCSCSGLVLGPGLGANGLGLATMAPRVLAGGLCRHTMQDAADACWEDRACGLCWLRFVEHRTSYKDRARQAALAVLRAHHPEDGGQLA